MIRIDLKEIVEAVSGSVKGELPSADVKSIVIDSRQAEENSVFIALVGEKADGHNYIAGIADRISCAVVEHEVDVDVPQIIVPSTYKAVGAIGAYIRKKSGVTVVGVTGSVGKTSVKELTASVLSQGFNVLKTGLDFL